MYNLLIVDDEPGILEWLEELFLYECSLELEVYTAGSGRKAVEVLNRVKCDVVLTDIKMPGMDGMQLYLHIKENWPRAKVVFLTGYRDHETLYEAVRNKEVRYLLKTEGDQKIVETVQEAFAEIEREKEAFLLEQRRGALFQKARYWLQKEFLERLIAGESDRIPEQEELKELGISLCPEEALLFFLGRLEQTQGEVSFGQREEIMEILRDTMPGILKVTGCILDYHYLLVLVQPKMSGALADWKRIFKISTGALEDMQELVEKKMNIKVSYTAFRKPAYLKEAAEKYTLLKDGLFSFPKGEEPGICILEENPIWNQRTTCKAGLVRLASLEDAIEQGKREECAGLLSEMTRPLLANVSKHDMGALELYYNIAMVYLKKINGCGLGEKIPFHLGLYKLTNAEAFENWQEAVNYLKQLNEVFFDLTGEENVYRSDSAIRRVEEYVREDPGRELSLTVLADVAGFNASYLSRIFKQKYQMNLSEYVTRERMKLARRLLVETGDKVNQIGERVGYPTPHSFTRAFKASEGLTPQEYRNRYRQERI